jgi:hypothetical protein
MLTHRFGELEPRHQERLLSASTEEIERWADALLEADSIVAVIGE